jgi:hypothetical protein
MSGTISGVSDASFNTQNNNKNKILAQIAANIERLPTFGSVLYVANNGDVLGAAGTLSAGAGTTIALSGSTATITAIDAGGTYSAGTGLSLSGTFPHETFINAGVTALDYDGILSRGTIVVGEGLSMVGSTLIGSDGLVISGAGVPTIYANAGIIYERYDQTSFDIDRVYVSNGTAPFLVAAQISDGANHQYVMNELSGTVALDTGSSAANGTYGGSYLLGQSGANANVPTSVLLGNVGGDSLSGWMQCPFTDVAPAAFTVEFLTTSIVGLASTIKPIFLNADPVASGNGFYIYGTTTGNLPGVKFGTTNGVVICQANFWPSGTINLVAMTYDGQTICLYCNGQLCGAIAAPGYSPSEYNLSVCYQPQISVGNIGQIFQCVATYPSALTTYQLAAHYDSLLQDPSWSDVQTMMGLNKSGNALGPFKSVQNLNGVDFFLNGENLQIEAFITVTGSSDVMSGGSAVSVSPVEMLRFLDNVRLLPGYTVRDVAVVYNTVYQNQPNPVPYRGGGLGCQIIYTEYFGLGGNPPSWFDIAVQYTVGNLEVWAGTTTSGMPVNSSVPAYTMDSDGAFIIITQPGNVAQSWANSLSGSGSSSLTFSVSATSDGRLYLQVLDGNLDEPITLSGDIDFDTIYNANFLGSTGSEFPQERAVLGEIDIVPGTYSVTASTSGTFSLPAVVGYIIQSANPNSVIVDVPPTQLFSSTGTLVAYDLLTLTAGPGLMATGASLSGTLTPYLTIEGDTVVGTLALGAGLGMSGTATENLTLSNTGVLDLVVQNSGTSQGTIAGAVTLNTSGAVTAALTGQQVIISSPGNTIQSNGTVETSIATTFDFMGAGVTVSGTGSTGTINISGSSLEVIKGAITYTAVSGIVAESGISASGTSGGLVTISTSGGSGTAGVSSLVQSTLTATGNITIAGSGATITEVASPATIVQSAGGYGQDSGFDITLGSTPTIDNLLVLTGSSRYTGPDSTTWTIVVEASESGSITDWVAYRVVESGDTNLWPFSASAGYVITEISGSESNIVTGGTLTETISGNVVSMTVPAGVVGNIDILTFMDFYLPGSGFLPSGLESLGTWTSTAYIANGHALSYDNPGTSYVSGYTATSAPGDNSAVYARIAPSAVGVDYSLNVPGSSLEVVDGATTYSGVSGIIAGSGISATGTSGGLVTISSTAASSGTLGVNYGGTVFPTLAAGSGFTLTGSGSVLTGSASGGGGGGFPYGNIGAVPVLSDFTWVNQGSATASQAGGAGTPIALTIPYNSATNWLGLFQTLPDGGTWTLYAWIRISQNQSNSSTAGIYLYDGTKLVAFEFLNQNSYWYLRVDRLNSVSSEDGYVAGTSQQFGMASGSSPVCLKIDLHSGTLTYSYSIDGWNFTALYSEANGSWLTPTEIGFGGINVNVGIVLNSLLGWSLDAV